MNKISKADKLWIAIVATGIPILEAGIIIALAYYLGSWLTFALVAFSTVIGFIWERLLWRKFSPEFKAFLEQPRQNSEERKDGKRMDSVTADVMAELMLFLGAFLLFLAPGFLTDGLGFTFLFPSTRKFWKQKILNKWKIPC